MRVILLICLLFLTYFSVAQKDSVAAKIWMGHYTDYLEFDTIPKRATFYTPYTTFEKRVFNYTLNDSLIILELKGTPMRMVFQYEYYGDSMLVSLSECSFPTDIWPIGKLRVLYALEKNSTSPWEKFYISHPEFAIEVTKTGNIYANFSGLCTEIGGLVGHYRGQLHDTTLIKLNKLIEEVQLGNASSSGRLDGPQPVQYYLFTKDHNFRGTSSGLGRERAEPIYYLLKSIDYKALKFQNYIGGDSVEGVFVVDLTIPRSGVQVGTIEKMGSFRTNAKILKPTYNYNFSKDYLIKRDRSKKKIRIYRFELLDGFIKSYGQLGEFVYLLSDTILNTSDTSIITFQIIRDFSRVSKMPKEPKAYFVLKQSNMLNKNDTIIVNSCYPQAFMIDHPEQTRFFHRRKGVDFFRLHLQSPFKTNYERAFKKYILRDWEKIQNEN